MENPLVDEIREHLRAYTSGQVNLRTFEEWFVPNIVGLADETTCDEPTLRLVDRIDLLLTEFGNGSFTQPELRRAYQKLIPQLGALDRPAQPAKPVVPFDSVRPTPMPTEDTDLSPERTGSPVAVNDLSTIRAGR